MRVRVAPHVRHRLVRRRPRARDAPEHVADVLARVPRQHRTAAGVRERGEVDDEPVADEQIGAVRSEARHLFRGVRSPMRDAISDAHVRVPLSH